MSVEWLVVFVFLGVAALAVAWVLRSRGGVSAHDDVQAQSEALRRELSVLVEKKISLVRGYFLILLFV